MSPGVPFQGQPQDIDGTFPGGFFDASSNPRRGSSDPTPSGAGRGGVWVAGLGEVVTPARPAVPDGRFSSG